MRRISNYLMIICILLTVSLSGCTEEAINDNLKGTSGAEFSSGGVSGRDG